jgi:tRNA A-37 threonylcarbamoyl transferase component Bud32/tetratricopeptide (TPR) repeat protein
VESAIDTAIRCEAAKLAAKASELVVGRRIGQYRVTGIIGTGGMGTIYRAVRDDNQYQKEVAIKVVKRGLDLEAVVGRFTRERQILARLEHPNVARLIDGGLMEDGQPYFVMEYVEGRPLTEYCVAKPLKEQLLLFREVCAGVQYSHQNLIVHRDLKPANILVTKDGVPKLLDFGLAKVFRPDELPEQTNTFVRMLTPDYASPEQVRGEVVNTATDIYSLGAILYELISGRHAHQFKARTTAEVERVICTTDPPPLAGELGNIAQMAMHKEPQRRYATVEQLSEDVRRYVEGLPVQARKDTIFYTFGKFVRRNKLAVAASTVALLILISATVLASFQARRLKRHLDAVRALATTMLFDVNRQIANLPGSLKARETLVKTGLAYLERVASEAGEDPALQLELARAYLSIGTLQAGPHVGEPNVGDREAARKGFLTALGLAESLHRRDPGNREFLSLLSTLHNNLGQLAEDPAEAIRHLKESIRVATGPGETAQGTASLADAYLLAGDPSAAIQTARATQVFRARHTEAFALYAMGDLAGAAALERANIARA